MRRTLTKISTTAAIMFTLAVAPMAGSAQNSNSSTGQMKESGSEARKAGTTSAHDVKHGRIVRGGKHFGKHMGRSGRHFASGTKRGAKKVFKRVVS
jgi:hypothetical protein